MVNLTLINSTYIVQPDLDSPPYEETLASGLSQQCLVEDYTNVTISCPGAKFKLNHILLAHASSLLTKIFLRQDLEFIDINYEIICPDFEAEAMKNILSLLYYGKAYVVENASAELYEEMRVILESLQIDIALNSIEMLPSDYATRDQSTLHPNYPLAKGNEEPLLHQCHYCQKRFQFVEALEKHTEKHMPKITVLPAETVPNATNLPTLTTSTVNKPSNSEAAKEPSAGPTPTTSVPIQTELPATDLLAGLETCTVTMFNDMPPVLEPITEQPTGPKSPVDSELLARGPPAGSEPMDVDETSSKVTEQPPPIERSLEPVATERFTMSNNILIELKDVQIKAEPLDLDDLHRFICSICRRAFSIQAALDRHHQRRHVTSKRQPTFNAPSLSSLNCKYCEKSFIKYNSMVVHLAKTHFYDPISEMCGSSKKSCNMCNKKFAQETSKLYHAAIVHKILEKYLTKDELKEMQSPRSSKPSKSPVHKNSEKSKDVKCSKCNFTAAAPYALRMHLAFFHYKEKIKAMFMAQNQGKGGTKECCLCKEIKSNNQNLIQHLVNKHNVLNRFMQTNDNVNITSNAPDEEIIDLETSSGEEEPIKSSKAIPRTSRPIRSFGTTRNTAPIKPSKPEDIGPMGPSGTAINNAPTKSRNEGLMVSSGTTTRNEQPIKSSGATTKNNEPIKSPETTTRIDAPIRLYGTDDKLRSVGTTCEICFKVSSSRAMALNHLARVHFKEEWTAYLGDEDEGKCNICEVTVMNREALKVHLVISHNEILDLL